MFDNEFNYENAREFLNNEEIEYHIIKPSSHSGNSDIERLNNTITEKIGTLYLENHLLISQQIYKTFMIYNDSYHTTIKCTPLEEPRNKSHNISRKTLQT